MDEPSHGGSRERPRRRQGHALAADFGIGSGARHREGCRAFGVVRFEPSALDLKGRWGWAGERVVEFAEEECGGCRGDCKCGGD